MGKWDEFESERYVIQDLGRVMPFLIPSCKLKRAFAESTIEDALHRLIKKYVGADTDLPIPYAGVWTNERGKTLYDESREYRVAFLGKERIPLLWEILAAVAKEIREEFFLSEPDNTPQLLLQPTQRDRSGNSLPNYKTAP